MLLIGPYATPLPSKRYNHLLVISFSNLGTHQKKMHFYKECKATFFLIWPSFEATNNDKNMFLRLSLLLVLRMLPNWNNLACPTVVRTATQVPLFENPPLEIKFLLLLSLCTFWWKSHWRREIMWGKVLTEFQLLWYWAIDK